MSIHLSGSHSKFESGVSRLEEAACVPRGAGTAYDDELLEDPAAVHWMDEARRCRALLDRALCVGRGSAAERALARHYADLAARRLRPIDRYLDYLPSWSAAARSLSRVQRELAACAARIGRDLRVEPAPAGVLRGNGRDPRAAARFASLASIIP